jgi:probable rRNA maturation factor
MKLAERTQKLVSLFPAVIRKKMPAEIQVVLVNTAASRRLNLRYRKKDKPTNVLSFRYSKEYSEIILCSVVIRTEAKAAGNTFDAQMTWMIVHGMLHLVGIHHEASATREQQFMRIEQAVLRKYRECKT